MHGNSLIGALGWCRQWLAWLLVGLALGCQPAEEPAETRSDPYPLPEQALRVETSGRSGGTLRGALLGSPSTFNFAMLRDLRSVLLANLTTATLLEYHRLNQTIVPGMASDWDVSPDARSITLHLRQGVNFSDGQPLTAEDVLFTFEKIYEEGSNNPLKYSLRVGGEPLKVTRLGDYSVEVRSAEPYAALEYILTTVPVFPKHLLDDPEKRLEDYWGLDTDPGEMAGLGPFVLLEHFPGQRSIFGFNPHYWRVDAQGVRLPYLDRFVVHYIEDRNAQLLRLQSGELDLLLDSLRPEDFVQLQGASNLRAVNAGPGSRLTFCWFNQSPGINPETGKPYISPEKLSWFSNLSFRRAVDAAISRSAIVQNGFLGQAQPAFSLVPASMPTWYRPEIKSNYNPEDPRELLRQAGFTWRDKGSGETLLDPQGREVRFSLLTISESLWGKIAAIIQQDLAQLGIEVSVKQEEFRAAISRITNSRDYDMALLALDFPADPVDHVSVLLSDSGMHFWNPGQAKPATLWEAEIDRLMLAQTTTLDLSERQRLYGSVQQILAEQLPFIPLINRDILIAASDRIQNLRPSHLSPHATWNVWELWLE